MGVSRLFVKIFFNLKVRFSIFINISYLTDNSQENFQTFGGKITVDCDYKTLNTMSKGITA